MKAVFFVNLNQFLGTFVNITLMHAVNNKGANSLDYVFFRMLGLLICSALTAKMMGVSLYLEPEYRLKVILRSFIGTVGFICSSHARPMISLVVQASIFSTVPFLAATLGFLIMGERLSFLEAGGLLVCAFSVLLIA